jgi:sugar lactone lactonase YvrE
VFIGGVDFGEGLRWHDDRLWYSDFFHDAVFAVDAHGARERVCDVPGQPSGLGWLPDGRLLVVSMLEERIYRLERDGTLAVHADISHLATHCNDMVVRGDGTAYVGHFGFDFFAGADGGPPQPLIGLDADGRTWVAVDRIEPSSIVGVTPQGDSWVAAGGLLFPNGCVVTPDGSTLVVAETVGQKLVAFPIAPDGALSGAERWTWAEAPDGCAIDAEGAIWYADATRGRVVRVLEGGAVTTTVETPLRAFACALGGDRGSTLFVMCAPGTGASELRGKGLGVIVAVDVDVPGAAPA